MPNFDVNILIKFQVLEFSRDGDFKKDESVSQLIYYKAVGQPRLHWVWQLLMKYNGVYMPF
jgi:hypothetical protein